MKGYNKKMGKTKLHKYICQLTDDIETHTTQYKSNQYVTTIPTIGIDNKRFVEYIEIYLNLYDLGWDDYKTKWEYYFSIPHKYNMEVDKIQYSNISIKPTKQQNYG